MQIFYQFTVTSEYALAFSCTNQLFAVQRLVSTLYISKKGKTGLTHSAPIV